MASSTTRPGAASRRARSRTNGSGPSGSGSGGGGGTHTRFTKATPHFFAPVKADNSFPRDALGRIPVFRTRAAATRAQRDNHWRANIGMGLTKWEKFRADHPGGYTIYDDDNAAALKVPAEHKGRAPGVMREREKLGGVLALAVTMTCVLIIIYANKWGWMDSWHKVSGTPGGK